jgi:hypothetical protein
MKILLESPLNSNSNRPASNQFHCLACQNSLGGGSLRTMLCHDDGAIAGDLCKRCVKRGTAYLQKTLGYRSQQLALEAIGHDDPVVRQRAKELAELANQPLSVPSFYQWWWKQMTLLATATQELEMARRSIPRQHPKPLKITFLTEEPMVGSASD